MALTPGVAAWTQGAVKTTASAPSMGQVNRYNATAGALTVTLPALSGLNEFARTMVQKDTLDATTNTVTFNRAGSDQFDDASTTFTLGASGESRTLQVVKIGGVKKWKITEAMHDDGNGNSTVNNILDFGVVRGTSASQTVAIKAALDANPGAAFYFPPGDYRLDTQLNITANNSVILAPGARIYANTAMTALINYDNGGTIANLAEDKFVVGYGELDANLLADTAIRVDGVLRFTIDGLTITDPVKRGIWADTLGAELTVHNIRIRNTTTGNVSDNIGIENNMGDCRYSNIVVRDLTVGVWDRAGATWVDVHPWLGDTASLTARYQNSVAFLLNGDSTLIAPYPDTYRYSFRAETASATARIVAPSTYANSSINNLTDALAASYPGVIFDLADGSGANFIVTSGRFEGHPTTHHAFTTGPTDRFVVADAIDGGGVDDVPIANTPKVTQILDPNGNVILGTNVAVGADNYFQVSNTAGGTPFLELGGNISNTPFGFAPNGSGGMFFWNNTQTALLWRIDGTQTDVSYNFVPKGAGRLQENGNNVGSWVAVPSTSTSTGKAGQMAADSSWLYICTATNVWRRVAVASW